ncbi:chorismate mutase [uncultured Sunxiuqinia sp.]|jgi:chorismate mutase|uniref:chorismate mutase n=1 Tax=uncultured Sunxiuqinia sp. TaxID=1573825 RepID=UPI0019876A82|nr:bifunctional 3-deoxy-7-phosphoheptulonate synthase/chorismate mutase type II [Sunxiuqinia sp.]|tara:strand:+ start:25056 stop:26147 length:1092 start_codon:yes stop_codon:yes gene_type:complete
MGIELDIRPMKDWLPQLDNPLLISGPCSLESEEQTLDTAHQLAKDKRVFVFRGGVWKPRTRPGSFEGVGSIGLKWLQKVKKETGLPVGTEVANAQHTEEALNAGLDVLWIGARSTASPFVVQEIADVVKGTDAVIMVKNPVNPDVQLWMGALERLNQAGIKNLVGIHRGFTSFGDSKYRNYPNWKTFIELRRLLPNLPVICDPSHIAGKRELLFEVSQKAFDLGMDGLMIESHRDPSCALSDKEQQVTPAELAKILDKLIIRQATSTNKQFENQLELLRNRIDALDTELMEVLSSRMEIAREIGRYKKENNVTALQISRWTELMNNRIAVGEKLNLNRTFVQILFQLIHEDSVRMQTEIMDEE